MQPRVVLLAVVLSLVVVAAGCALPLPASPAPLTVSAPPPPPTAPVLTSLPAGGISADTIVIGMSAAFNGPSKGLGIELYRGSMAYIEAINRRGGINGRKIVVRAYNDGYNPIPAIENTIHLIETDDVFLTFNYVGTPTVTRILPLLKRYHDRQIYLFFPFTGAQPQREPPYDAFVFNLRASYRQETAGLVDHLISSGRQRIAVFYQADAYGRSGWDGVQRALAQHGLRLAAEATYQRGIDYTQSMRQQVAILRAAQPDAVIVIGAYAASAAFIRDARDAGWDIPIANVSFVGSESMLNLLVEAERANGKDYTSHLINSQVVPSYEDTSLPAVQEYRKLMATYTTALPPGIAPEGYQPATYSFVGFEGFLNAKLLVEILTRMGPTPRREQLAATVEGIQNLDLGINVPISFGPDKHQGLDAVYYMTVQASRFVPLTDWKGWRQ